MTGTTEQAAADMEAARKLTEAIGHAARAYGVPPRVSTQWAVAWGSADLNDGVGYVELYDDEEDAREHVPFYKGGGSVVKRTVISLPWEAVSAGEEACGCTNPVCSGAPCGEGQR